MILATFLHICSMPRSLKISLSYLEMRIYQTPWIPNAVAKMLLQEMRFTGLEAFNENGSYQQNANDECGRHSASLIDTLSFGKKLAQSPSSRDHCCHSFTGLIEGEK